ncbi:MAG: YibE/F family protein [Ilumatobacteraceae bacterium]
MGNRASDHALEHALDASPSTARRVRMAVTVWVAGAAVAAVAMWPSGDRTAQFPDVPRVAGQVTSVEIAPCTGTAVADLVECRIVSVLLTTGEEAGSTAVLELAVTGTPGRQVDVGDRIFVRSSTGADGRPVYQFADYRRSGPMWVLAVLFATVVVALGRWRGVGALGGLVVGAAVLVGFVLPALLDGSSPVLVAVVGASIVAAVALLLAHGPGPATEVALLSTLVSLSLTGVLAWAFVGLTSLTGLSDENALLLGSLGVSIDPRGLLLAGVVIGSLGVLDDVTVTQVAVVGELHHSQPAMPTAELVRRAMSVGRDHISSTVNTLFLAYAGAALPLLLLFTETGVGVAEVVTSETVAIEVVRTLVGSIGLVASVPISTWLAAAVLRRDPLSRAGGDGEASAAAV